MNAMPDRTPSCTDITPTAPTTRPSAASSNCIDRELSRPAVAGGRSRPAIGHVADAVAEDLHPLGRAVAEGLPAGGDARPCQAAARPGDMPLLDAAYEVGLSGPGRLHDLFVTHEAMSPGEWKAKGDGPDDPLRLPSSPVRPGAGDGDRSRACRPRLLPIRAASRRRSTTWQRRWPQAQLCRGHRAPPAPTPRGSSIRPTGVRTSR